MSDWFNSPDDGSKFYDGWSLESELDKPLWTMREAACFLYNRPSPWVEAFADNVTYLESADGNSPPYATTIEGEIEIIEELLLSCEDCDNEIDMLVFNPAVKVDENFKAPPLDWLNAALKNGYQPPKSWKSLEALSSLKVSTKTYQNRENPFNWRTMCILKEFEEFAIRTKRRSFKNFVRYLESKESLEITPVGEYRYHLESKEGDGRTYTFKEKSFQSCFYKVRTYFLECINFQ